MRHFRLALTVTPKSLPIKAVWRIAHACAALQPDLAPLDRSGDDLSFGPNFQKKFAPVFAKPARDEATIRRSRSLETVNLRRWRNLNLWLSG